MSLHHSAGEVSDLSAFDALSNSSTPRLLGKGSQAETAKAVDKKQGAVVPGIDNMDSDYSLDLAALGSAVSTMALDREEPKIHSEAIGGPSDFTVNLAEYINGM